MQKRVLKTNKHYVEYIFAIVLYEISVSGILLRLHERSLKPKYFLMI